MSYIICFNATGSDSITYVYGHKSIESAHEQAMKHYNAMKKLKGGFSHQYGIADSNKLSEVNTKQFVIAEYK